MPRRFFKSISPTRASVLRQRWLAPLRHWLDAPNLWAIRRRSVAPGVALGLFWAWMPLPGHSVLSALSAIGLGVHLPLATVMTFLTNPVTILPMYYAAYRVGIWLLNQPERSFNFELSMHWLTSEITTLGPPLLLGCVLLGALTALLGFIAVDLVWRTRIGDYLRERQRRKAQAH
ncbi:MAG: DUF2062 domain-containing protein [Pseudomonadota bacterium]